jgi:hypothetical protein
MKTAYDLHRAFPEAELIVCGKSGHSANEAEITSELVLATEHLAHRHFQRELSEMGYGEHIKHPGMGSGMGSEGSHGGSPLDHDDASKGPPLGNGRRDEL